jgi:antitoxin component YwqK of YwqJK toxin-antitoxin module
MKLTTLFFLLGLLGVSVTGGALNASWAPWAADKERVYSHRYSNGQLKSQVAFRDGLRDGEATFWFEDGSLKGRGQYEDERMEGRWEWYLADGSEDPEQSGLYADGEKVSD